MEEEPYFQWKQQAWKRPVNQWQAVNDQEQLALTEKRTFSQDGVPVPALNPVLE
jgi:hypothetical protein